MKCQDATWLLTTAGKRGNELPSKGAQTMSSCIWSCIKSSNCSCWLLYLCRHLWPQHLCCCIGFVNTKAHDKEGCCKYNLQVLDLPEGIGGRSTNCPMSLELHRSHAGQYPARGRWSCQAILEHGLHPIQLYLCPFVSCWLVIQPMFYFPPVSKGQSRALEYSCGPVTANKQTVSADNEGLPKTGKGKKAKQSSHHTSCLLHMSSNLIFPISGLHHRLSVW